MKSEITFHENCAYMGENFHIRVKLSSKLAKLIASELKAEHFHNISINGISMEFQDLEIKDEALNWAFGYMNGSSFSFENCEDYLQLDLSCPKLLEGDDKLDVYSASGKLPELFWIEPANLIRSLMQAVNSEV